MKRGIEALNDNNAGDNNCDDDTVKSHKVIKLNNNDQSTTPNLTQPRLTFAQQFHLNQSLMRSFKETFNSENDIELTINGVTFKKSECKKVGGGSEKSIYSIPGTDLCFFVPARIPLTPWDELITNEKKYLDKFISLGLKAQAFEVSKLTMEDKTNNNIQKINVLVTTTFENLTQKGSMIIFNPKETTQYKFIPKRPCLLYNKDIKNFESPDWNKKLISSIVKEYITAVAFDLPVTGMEDDGRHLCIDLPANSNEPPILHFMFWDVPQGIYDPTLPPLSFIKTKTLKALTEFIAIMIQEALYINSEEREALKMADKNQCDMLETIEKHILSAITDDMLNEAYTNARHKVATYMRRKLELHGANILRNYFPTASADMNENAGFVILLFSSYTSGDLALVKDVFNLIKNKEGFVSEYQEMLISLREDNLYPEIEKYLTDEFSKYSISSKQEDKTASTTLRNTEHKPGAAIVTKYDNIKQDHPVLPETNDDNRIKDNTKKPIFSICQLI